MMLKFMPQVLYAPETLTGALATKKAGVHGHGYAGALYGVYGYYDVAANVEDGDIFELVYTPKNFLALFGGFVAADLDTGTEAIDIDIGWKANGGGAETYTAPWGEVLTNAAGADDPDGLVNSGVLTGDAIATDLVAAGVNWRPFIMPTPKFFSRPTLIQAEANAAADSFAAGRISVHLFGWII